MSGLLTHDPSQHSQKPYKGAPAIWKQNKYSLHITQSRFSLRDSKRLGYLALTEWVHRIKAPCGLPHDGAVTITEETYRLLQRELKEWIIYNLLLLGQNWTCIGKWFASKKSKVDFQLKLLDLPQNKNWGDKCRKAQNISHYLECSWLECICQLSGIFWCVKHNHIDQLTHQLKFYGLRSKRM